MKGKPKPMKNKAHKVCLLMLLFTPLPVYWQALSRYFVSEDFIHIRILSGRTISGVLGSDFVAPFLGITAVKFYRPVATFIFGVEYLLFGIHPLPYTLLHLMVHGLNSCLVYLLARHLFSSERWQEPFCAALLFTLYPLQSNAVLFIGSFSAFYGTLLTLVSLNLFAGYRIDGRIEKYMGSLVFCALALACYEQAVVLPALIAGCDFLLHKSPFRQSIIGRLKVYFPYLVIVVLYFGVRYLVLGVFIGGYGGLSISLDQWKVLFAGLMNTFWKMLNPSWEGGELIPHTAVIAAVIGGLTGLSLWIRISGKERDFAGLVIFSLTWVVVCLAPFQFPGVVPANARYWYLAVIGIILGILAFAGMIARLLKVRSSLAACLATSMLLVYWAPLLMSTIENYVKAGALTLKIQETVVKAKQEDAASSRIFISGYPMFIRTKLGAQVAQVFHWGLRDAVGPPFIDEKMAVFALPPLDRQSLLVLAMNAEDANILIWDEKSKGLVPFVATPEEEQSLAKTDEIRVVKPKDGTGFEADKSLSQVLLEPTKYPNLTLVLASPSTGTIIQIDREKQEAPVRVKLPRLLIELQKQLYGNEVLWWVEARDDKGRLRAFTRIQQGVNGSLSDF